ncbi:hypothetical protein [Lentilitoribacter sp. Alg239-R112]|uniref:hypothetical protein n=1 Tax=Lentilitoribacter sp. Alg239-R112 TaxID=2305987 RepID=UPI0013A6A6A8|nr:hypothetical protein [Lentilitoribacter sp. Alg239-R112]
MGWFAILVVCLSPIWGAVLIELLQCYLRPVLLDRVAIQQEIESLYVKYSDDAFSHAVEKENRAIRDCDSYQIGYWRGVRKEIMRIEQAKGYTFKKVR